MKYRFLFFTLVLWLTDVSPAEIDRKLLADDQQGFNVTYNYVSPCCSFLSPMETFKLVLLLPAKFKFGTLKSFICAQIKSKNYKCHDIDNLEYYIYFNKDRSSVIIKPDNKLADNMYFDTSEVKITVTSWD